MSHLGDLLGLGLGKDCIGSHNADGCISCRSGLRRWRYFHRALCLISEFAVYFQESPDSWIEAKTDNAGREGMTIGDVDGDGDYDVVMNGFWLGNPRRPRRDTWKRHDIDPTWYKDITGGWQDHSVMADVKDLNNDGEVDVILSHSEKPGFTVAWYESANPKGGPDAWTKHEVGVVDYCHTLRGDDVDLDGDIDIVAATLIRKKNPEICAFVNEGRGLTWRKQPLAAASAYKARTGDIDNDGDIDIVTARSTGRSLCRDLGLSGSAQVKVATAISALARNIVRHAGQGEIEMQAVEEGARRGIEIVALKRGAAGSTVFTADRAIEVPSMPVTEVDPTGAGDCYGGAFVVGLLEGWDLPRVARFANVVGALAVTKKRPMEGAPWREDVVKYL